MGSRLFFVSLLFIAGLSSCVTYGITMALEGKTVARQSKDTRKIVCINPTFSTIPRKRMTAGEAATDFAKKNKWFRTMLTQNAKLAKFDLQIIDGNQLKPQDQVYFNDLAPLLSEMVLAVGYQSGRLNTEASFSWTQSRLDQHREWETSPLIDSRFSFLSKKFGTPWFMYAFLAEDPKTFDAPTAWRAVVADVDAGAVFWAEFRIVGFKPRKDIVDFILYDFFNSLRHAKNQK